MRFKKSEKVHFVRYADDFIITGESRGILANEVKPLVSNFLKERGLSLSEEKTHISHIDDGFDFLGFNIRKYRGKLLIKASKTSIVSVETKVREILKANKTAKTDNVIGMLNPVIRGWANFYRHVVSQEIYDKIDSAIWKMTWQWAVRRHPNKPLKWIKSKYFQRECFKDWVFCEKGGKLQLLRMSDTPIRRHIKIKAGANPYDPHWHEYFEKRSTTNTAGCLTVPYQGLSPVR